jgi:hypothetical protein
MPGGRCRSMIQMDQGWQEVKLGRVFREGSRIENGTKEENEIRYKLEESIYSGHLGSYLDFIPKFEASLGTYNDHENRLVFITDGAQWIHNYLTNRFPDAIHILDRSGDPVLSRFGAPNRFCKVEFFRLYQAQKLGKRSKK